MQQVCVVAFDIRQGVRQILPLRCVDWVEREASSMKAQVYVAAERDSIGRIIDPSLRVEAVISPVVAVEPSLFFLGHVAGGLRS